MSEPRYTLTEARHELNRRECANYGHDYGHLVDGRHEPIAVYCERCGKRWQVTPR